MVMNTKKSKKKMAHNIGSLNEKPLHTALKKWYAMPGDLLEEPVDGFVIDIVRGDILIEIQTRNFFAIKRKLIDLTARHKVRLVYPVAREKWIIKLEKDGYSQLNRRKSPRKGAIIDVFSELRNFPQLLLNPNFSIEVLLIHEEEFRRHDDRRGWRRKGWVTHERRLLKVVEQQLFEIPSEMSMLIPSELAGAFTSFDLAAAINKPLRLSQRMILCLREMGIISKVGKRGRAFLYTRNVNK